MEQKIEVLQKELTETKKNMEIKERLKKAEEQIENQDERIKALERETGKRNSEIQQAYRLEEKAAVLRSDRLILIEFTSPQKRIEVIRKAKHVKGSKIWISENYLKPVQEAKRQLLPYLKTAREEGHKAKIIHDKSSDK
ncbi:hypothetical protein ILUMI_13555 [Ignelater luminosus]|uniref:Uncharacterized protein n=1 Tax=Ignelater luminosus TaxID=2038154 RepID=A0A8K0GBB8_IGNLU|nr:hypothetical protein ILUMI_13555 [Ignelater luminosus]